MKEKRAPRLWKVALPSAAALVLVVGTLITGGLDWERSTLNAAPQAGVQRARQLEGEASKAIPRMAVAPDMVLEESELPAGGMPMDAEADYSAGASYDLNEESAAAPEAAAGTGAQVGTKIVRTAYLTLATNAFDQDEEALRAAVAHMGGYVENFNQYGDGSEDNLRSLTMTVRIPSERLDEFLAGAATIGRVTGKSENTTDMTVQYADTALQLETQRSKMERLQALLQQAESVSDLLEIETEIANTQYWIDSYETNLRGIDRRVENSTVTVTLTEETPAESANASGTSLGGRAANALAASVSGIGRFFENMLVFVVLAAPWAAGLAVISGMVWIIVKSRRKSKRKKDKTED